MRIRRFQNASNSLRTGKITGNSEISGRFVAFRCRFAQQFRGVADDSLFCREQGIGYAEQGFRPSEHGA